MKNDNALISTAVLTAIWDDSHKDNIELVIPFVIDIIYNKYEVSQSIDEEFILEQLKNRYCFNNFPHAVLKTVLNRIKKKGILKIENKKYRLEKEIKEEAQKFEEKLRKAKNDTSKVIEAITSYLKEEMNENITSADSEVFLGNFIATYGYNAYENINSIKAINRKTDVTNYLIGEFICRESKLESDNFKLILRIIEGYMIANAIYLQIDNDNKASLKKLNCYLDTPLLLRILGYKTDEENESAKELYDLLTKYGATLNCFTHTFDELHNILSYYKNNINRNKELTLEYFDKEGYTEGQVEMAISVLENKFKEMKINIVEPPEYTEDKYKNVIDVASLENKLTEHKKTIGNYFNPNSISNDVKSVCAINMLRNGKKFTKIENCTHIFVTPYQYLKVATKEVMLSGAEMGIDLIIDDLDLTTILWLKDFGKNDNLPKMRLVENALAATNASDEIMAKASGIYESIIKDGLIKDSGNISDCITKNYLKTSGYVDSIKNDSELVTKENLIEFFNKKDREIEIAEKKIGDIKKELEQTKEMSQKKELDVQKKFIDEIEQKANKKFKNLKIIVLSIYYLVLIVIIILGIIAVIKTTDTKKNMLLSTIAILIGVVGIFDQLVPRAKFVMKHVDKFFTNKKRDYITSETKKIMDKYE